MSVRRTVVEVSLEGLNVSEFCRQHGISTWLFYQLRRRFAEGGEAALESRSRAAQRIVNRIPGLVEEAIIVLRKELAENGWDAGPATIFSHLPARLEPGTAIPSEATIWRVLKRRGLIIPEPKKAPGHSYKSFSAERVNQCWQIDDTGWALADGTTVKIIAIVDDCTRVAVTAQAATTCNTASSFAAFSAAAERWGWPARFLSDNAKHFRHGLKEALSPLGIEAGHSRPYHPQTCGKVERFHQTLKRFLAAQPPPSTLHELQTQLDRFLDYYNHQRPHRSLGRRTPAQVFATTPKTGPGSHSLNPTTTLHQVKVSNGTCSINRTYNITIGAVYNNQTATVIITGLACHVFIDGRLVRQLTLTRGRRTQPLYQRPGRPTVKPANQP